MPRRIHAAALLAAALALAPGAARAGLAESWYLARGRANLRIANYAAAAEAYRKALAENPRSREASRGVCRALLGNGSTDLAVAELDRHLARFPDDAELAFEQARILSWSRYAYRARDAARYLRMGLAVKDDPARRRDLARLLARDRATAGEALAEYDRLLAAAPRDAALRAERLALLLWDPARAPEAIAALRERLAEAPRDDEAARHLARLLAADARTAPEACQRYEALLARHPADADLRLGHARALVRAGRRAEARAAYDRALAARPSPEVRLERAELLASDPATRDAAVADYQAVLKATPGSRRARLGLARALGARKETAPGAIQAYQAVLASTPRDGEAHRGLALAYAWSGDADRALAHGALAERYGPRRADVADTTRALRRGREPAAGGGARLLAQPGGAFALATAGGFVRGEAEPTPFTSSDVVAGWASHRGGGDAAAEGGFVRVGAGWRPSPRVALRLEGGWDGARLGGQGGAGLLRVVVRGDQTSVAGEAYRSARHDSFRAFAGERIGGEVVGAASEQGLAVRLTFAPGAARPVADEEAPSPATRLALGGSAGAVVAPGLDPVWVAGASARLDRRVGEPGRLAVWVGLAGRATHHARDVSGLGDPVDAGAPRLFSPPLQLDASPRLGLVLDRGLAGGLRLDAGPALQLVTGPRGAVRAGGDLSLTAWRRVGDRLRLGVEGSAERLASAYTRVAASATAEVLWP